MRSVIENRAKDGGTSAGSGAIWSRVIEICRRCMATFPARREKRLKLCETLSLGERRFVAVVRYREQQFLVGGTGQTIALLAHLPPAERDEGETRGGSRLELA